MLYEVITSTTSYKNVNGEVLEESVVAGDYSLNMQVADISAVNKALFMGGDVEVSAEVTEWKKDNQVQGIRKSVMIIHKNMSITYAVNVALNAYLATSDEDLAYIQVNGTALKPEKEGVNAIGSYEGFDKSANDIKGFVLDEQTGAASINTTLHTVSIEVEAGTDITKLSPYIKCSIGAYATPCGSDEIDFSQPVVFAVEAADGTTQNWTVTVTEA